MRAIFRFIILVFISSAVSLSAGTLWSGNAVRGSEDDFNSYYDRAGTYLGASRALPAGTVLEVTNQLNEESVTITIIGENSRPGVFLLLSPEAALQVSLDQGEMILVQAQEKPGSGNSLFQAYQEDRDAYMEENAYDEPLNSKDPDNNILATSQEELNALNQEEDVLALESEETIEELTEETDLLEEGEETIPLEVVIAVDPEEELPEEEILEEIPEENIVDPLIEETPEEEILPENYDEVVVGSFGSREVIPLVEPAGPDNTEEKEIFPLEEIEEETPEEDNPEEALEETPEEEMVAAPVEVAEEPLEETVEKETPEENAEEEAVSQPEPVDRVIYFLTPAELKPPEVVHIDDNGEDTTVSLIPQEVTPEELDELIKIPLEKGKRYIQVAAFTEDNLDFMYQKMAELKVFFPMLLLDPVEGKDTYRLLVGPASRDEMGVLLKYHLPAQGFTDALEYKQN